LGAEISRDYQGKEPLLVAPLKASLVFVSDLSRALSIQHGLDFIELASYGSAADTGGHSRIRLLKDLDCELAGRNVLIVEDVVDTGLTLNYLCKTFSSAALRHWRRRPCSTGPTDGSSTICRSATWASRSPTSSSSATASTSTRSFGICRTSTCSAQKFSLG